ncbi:MAG: MBL fold metallo-hydrolase [Planctomycetota bacterium]
MAPPPKAGPQSRVDPLKNYWGDLVGFYNRQAQASLDLVNEMLLNNRPQLPEPRIRRLALVTIDTVLHEESAAKRPAVQEFYHGRIRKVIRQMESKKVGHGAVIWKLYNHGFVVRTCTVTIGFDLIRGHLADADGFALDDELMNRLVAQCDVLFISHHHGDHADGRVARAFLKDNKPVATPADVWSKTEFYGQITHLQRKTHTLQTLPIQNGKHRLRVVVYPGHQGRDTANNVSLVFSPEGMSFCHMGDQSNSEDFDWIDRVNEHHRVDVLMPNCWTTDMSRTVRGFGTNLVISGHENELGHSIDHREPYWLTYDRSINNSSPLVLMTWGESFYYQPPQKAGFGK